jgi:hypothetical protein
MPGGHKVPQRRFAALQRSSSAPIKGTGTRFVGSQGEPRQLDGKNSNRICHLKLPLQSHSEYCREKQVMDDTTIVGDSVAVVTSPSPGGWGGGWSGVSWSAVIAGALTAIAVSFIVISLGSGIGMELVSPYSYSSSLSAGTMTVIGAVWLVFAQAVGFATGGYVAGRMRRSPAPLHTNEVKFRDGANGLVVWAIGVVVTFFILVTVVGKVTSATGSAAAGIGTTAVGIAGATSQSPSVDYFTDTLLRPNPQNAVNGANAGAAGGAAAATPSSGNEGSGAAASQSNSPGARPQQAQVNRILVTALSPNGLSNDDHTYLAQLVAAQTGVSQDEAQRRVDTVIAQMKQDATQAAETARKAAAYLSFWTFMSLLFGAVCATLGGILGGDLRDEVATRELLATSPR